MGRAIPLLLGHRRPNSTAMTLGASLSLIGLGAILKYAVTARVSWIDLQATGVILMATGGLGLVLVLFFWSWSRSRGTAPPPEL